MHIVRLRDAGRNFTYQWPDSSETYDYYVEYVGLAEDGEHTIRIAFGKRFTYGKERVRVIVFIDGYPHAEFFSADDFEKSGDLLSEIKIPGSVGERICKYPDEPVPERYSMFNVVGLPVHVQAKGVHNAWAVVSNIADHKTLIALAALRRLERQK